MLSDIHARGGLAIEGYEMLKGLDGVATHEHREWLPILDEHAGLGRRGAAGRGDAARATRTRTAS